MKGDHQYPVCQLCMRMRIVLDVSFDPVPDRIEYPGGVGEELTGICPVNWTMEFMSAEIPDLEEDPKLGIDSFAAPVAHSLAPAVVAFPCAGIREVFGAFDMKPVRLKYSVSKGKQTRGEELLIRN